MVSASLGEEGIPPRKDRSKSDFSPTFPKAGHDMTGFLGGARSTAFPKIFVSTKGLKFDLSYLIGNSPGLSFLILVRFPGSLSKGFEALIVLLEFFPDDPPKGVSKGGVL